MKNRLFFSIAFALCTIIFLVGCKENGPEVSGFDLNKTEVSLRPEETVQLIAVFTPEGVSVTGSVSWQAEDNSIATVSDNGLVTAVSVGETSIIAKYGKNFTASCRINVTESGEVESVRLNKIEMTLVKGESEALEATIYPEDAKFDKMEWESSDSKIVSVSDKGVVSAIDPGKAVVSVKVAGVEASCDVTVLAKETENVILSESEIEILKDKTFQLTARIEPEGTGATVLWSSSDAYTVSVNSDGVVKGNRPGEAVVIATAGKSKAECRVVVLPVDAESITLSVTNITLEQGETAEIIATVQPENYDGKLAWTSDNVDVAVVDLTGKVTATGEGTAKITVSIDEISAVCNVTVNKSSGLNVGDYYYSDGTYSADLDPSKTPIGIVFWKGNATTMDPVLAKEHPNCTHGLVVALNQSDEGICFMENFEAYSKAMQYASIEKWLAANCPDYYLTVNLGGSDMAVQRQNIQGYNNTKAIEMFNAADENQEWPINIIQYAVDYRKSVKAPESSSDWYIPCPKELSLLCVGEYDGDLMSISLMYKTNIRDLVNRKIRKIEGAKKLTDASDNQYWTSSICAGTPTAFTMNMYFGWVSLANVQSGLQTRCILAF